jgi:hypothetical protein
MILTGENRRNRRKTCPTATLSTTNHTWTNLGANPSHRVEKPATNRLRYETALAKRTWSRNQVLEVERLPSSGENTTLKHYESRYGPETEKRRKLSRGKDFIGYKTVEFETFPRVFKEFYTEGWGGEGLNNKYLYVTGAIGIFTKQACPFAQTK